MRPLIHAPSKGHAPRNRGACSPRMHSQSTPVTIAACFPPAGRLPLA